MIKIYNLHDEIAETKAEASASRIAGNRGGAGAGAGVGAGARIEARAGAGARMADGGVRRVTDLKQGVKNPNRVNVFVDGTYALSLDVAQMVDLGVKVGLEIDAAKLAELKKASEFGKAYQRALEWVLARPRSERELRDYLRRRERTAEAKERQKEWQEQREWQEGNERQETQRPQRPRNQQEGQKPQKRRAQYDFDDLIVERLMERGYVDDKKFAEYFVENRLVKKGVSRKRLEMELMQKGVVRGIVEEVIGGRSDEEEIQKIIAKKRAKYDDEKLIQYLCRQGFSYELVRSLVRNETD